MEHQKQSTLELVATQRGQGRRVSEVLSSLGVARSNYYRWKKDAIQNPADRQSCYEVTAEELKQIDLWNNYINWEKSNPLKVSF